MTLTLPLEVNFRNMDASDAVEAYARERAARLERFAPHIMSCRVAIEAPHRHSHKGKLFAVTVDISVPGDEIVVNKVGRNNHAHEDVYVAIRDHFDAAERKLEDWVRKRRGKVKSHEAPPHGTVTHLAADEDYGFVTTSEGLEIYFHRNAVANGGFDQLAVGDEVRLAYVEGESDKGPQATTVTPLGKRHIVA